VSLGVKREEVGVAIPVPDDPSLDGGVLEGRFVPGAPETRGGVVVAPPHPLYGGSMDSPVVNEVAWTCNRAGLASLSFNWRGVDASAGEPSGDAIPADADYAAALEQLALTVEGPLVAAGYSFGAATAVRVAPSSPRVDRLVLVSPPPALLDANALAGFDGGVLIVSGEHDTFAPVAELTALASESPRARFVVVPDADHFFATGLAEVSRAVAEWIGPGAVFK